MILIIGGIDKISLVNVYRYELIREINVFNSINNCGFCMLNENMFITGDSCGKIRQWKIEDDNIKIISIKNVNEKPLLVLFKIGNGRILSSSSDNFIRIW